jgi:DNA-directed RNA polymerase specialized sigma24 family protein
MTPIHRRGTRRVADPAAAGRADKLARVYRDRADELHAYVATIARTDTHTIEDACAFAWMQLLAHPEIDLDAASHDVMRWLTTTAAREAWRLHKQRGAAAHADLDARAARAVGTASGVENLAARRVRLDLVRELPERPRRFLLRHMLGYSYDGIAALEHVSRRTTEKQLARARRLLRDLDAREND